MCKEPVDQSLARGHRGLWLFSLLLLTDPSGQEEK